VSDATKVNPQTAVTGLIERIASTVLKTYEIERLLKSGAGHRFSLAAHQLVSAIETQPLKIGFECVLSLQPELLDGKPLPEIYKVRVTGEAAYERPVWRLNELTDVTVESHQTGMPSAFSDL
jgi:hypothetical protein